MPTHVCCLLEVCWRYPRLAGRTSAQHTDRETARRAARFPVRENMPPIAPCPRYFAPPPALLPFVLPPLLYSFQEEQLALSLALMSSVRRCFIRFLCSRQVPWTVDFFSPLTLLFDTSALACESTPAARATPPRGRRSNLRASPAQRACPPLCQKHVPSAVREHFYRAAEFAKLPRPSQSRPDRAN